jgi:hypothetical protein
MTPKRKLRQLRIHYSLLPKLLSLPKDTKAIGVPLDLIVVAAYPNPETQSVLLICESKVFAPIPEGEELPHLTITYTQGGNGN